MKIIKVGDPHVRVDNLEESERLLAFIEEKAIEFNIDQIDFMGDLFHNHAVIRVEVLDFWKRWTKRLSKTCKLAILVGNHDQVGNREQEQILNSINFLEDKEKGIVVANKPTLINDTLYVPYYSEEEDFKKAVSDSSARFLCCHQTFNGSTYENGFYAKDGFDLEIVKKFEVVYAGHIHRQQKFANIFYIGTPRWDGINDANEKKGIWIGSGNNYELIPTHKVCTPLIAFEVKEGEEIPEIPNGRVLVTLIGSSSWIGATSKKIKGARIIPKPTDSKDRSNSGASSLISLDKYAEKFKFDPMVNANKVLDYIGKLV